MKKGICFTLALLIHGFQCLSQTLVYSAEAESGSLTGLVIKEQEGTSSGKYVSGFDADGDRITLLVKVPKTAIYRLHIAYRANQGAKIQDLYIGNALVANIHFPESSNFKDLDAGGVSLQAGFNKLDLQKSWGYVDIDKFSFYTTTPHTYEVVDHLIDAKASPATQELYAYMRAQYGKMIISGQTDSYYDKVEELTYQKPMIMALDLATYCPQYAYKWDEVNGGHMFGPVDNKIAEKAIAWYQSTKKKGIVSFQWHWFSPSGGTLSTNTFSTSNTSFDVSKAVIEGTPEHDLILRDIDAIAVPLQKLSAANIPVLWRPLHEAGGGWFWWGAKGASASKALYDIVYERLTVHHNLHNLIWVWSSPEAEWYPGNDKVDIIGYDAYPGDYIYTTQKAQFDLLYDIVEGKKLIAMTENGSLPDVKGCIASDAPWSYFMTWSDLLVSQNETSHIKEVYNDPNVITLGYQSLVTTVSESSLESSALVYPNPAKDKIWIADALLNTSINKVEIWSMNGALQYVKEAGGPLNISDFQSGMYVVKVYTEDQMYLQKVYKE